MTIKPFLIIFCICISIGINAQLPIAYFGFEQTPNGSFAGNGTAAQLAINSGCSYQKTGTGTLASNQGAGASLYSGPNNGLAATLANWPTPSTNPATSPTSSFEFTVNTTGLSTITFTFDYYVTGIKSIFFPVPYIGMSYSINGGTTWISVGSTIQPLLRNIWLSSSSYALPATANNINNLKVRIYGYNANTATDQLRIDNVNFYAAATNNNAGVLTSVDERSLYSYTTSGGTGIFARTNFTINSGSELILGSDVLMGTLLVSSTISVANGGTLTFGTSASPKYLLPTFSIFNIPLSGTLTTTTGATLKITDANGIALTSLSGTETGNVRVLTRTYAQGANYTYIGGSPQITGNGLPTTINGNLTINNNSGVTLTQNTTENAFLYMTNGVFNISGRNLTLNGNISGTGTLTTSTATNLTVGGSTTNLGTVYFTGGIQTLNTFTLNRTGIVTNPAVVLGSSLNINSLALTNGILATGNNLLTWNNSGGTFSNPTPANSFIATCNAAGTVLTAVGLNTSTTSPFAGNVGFRIKNITKTMSAAMVFPVSADFVSPNRMSIRPANNTSNTGTTDITVVVAKGDFGYTPNPRVNRIWYTHATTPAAVVDCSIGLYFKKRIPSDFGISQDEVESGFNPLAVEVGRKDYTDLMHLTHRSISESVGIMDGVSEATVFYNSSSALPELPGYYKFSVGNFGTIILPSLITNIKAAAENNKVNIQWTALNELNVDHYEIEHSATANNFRVIAKTTAASNGNNQHNYVAVHEQPLQGKNFYRVKSVDKDGTVHYTSVVSVIIGGNKIAIAVIPNPVQNKLLNLQLNNIPAGRYNVMLYNTTGQRMYTKYIDHTTGSSMQTIPLPNSVSKGAYVLKIINENNHFTDKVIIE